MNRESIHKYSTRKSPGDGITKARISREPLATEGEATPGPDDVNPFLEEEDRRDRGDSAASAFPELPSFADEGNDGEFPEFPDF